MGFNKLRNLTEGMLRGLGKLQYLYLQANLIETVAPNTFWECPNIENIDLSMNRYQCGYCFFLERKRTGFENADHLVD